jgi:16S rRNA (guanine1207-N2)-methyltransferase
MSHYFINDDKVSSNEREISYLVNGISFSLKVDNGVFSKDRLDLGSEFFIETLLKSNLGKNILDIGCGYGPIGLTLAKLTPSLNVTCSDVNTRALALCEKNARLLNLDHRVTCLQSDIYNKIEGLYDSIVSNPPIRAGKKVTYEIYNGARDHLIDGGSLYIVIRKAQGALSAKAYIETLYGNCEIIAKHKGYLVLKAVKKVN